LQNTHGGVVLFEGHVYGHSESGAWVCQELKTGKVKWQEEDKLPCASGSLTCAGGQLYLYSDGGVVVLLKATAEGGKGDARFSIPQKSNVPPQRPTSRSAKIWTHPVVANGRLYLRDQELLFCFDVREKK